MTTKRKTLKRRRNGIFLLDICVGLAMVAVALYVLTLAAFQLAEHRNDRKMRQVAADTLMNVSEILDAEALGKPESPEFTETVRPLRETTERALPDGKLDFRVLPDSPGENLAIVEIAVSYDNGKNRPRREFRLLRLVDISEQKNDPTTPKP